MLLTRTEPPQIGIRMEEVSTVVYINDDCKGPGTLYITENDIIWLNNVGEGISVKYPDISLFAVCTDHEKYQEDCVFMLVKDEDAEEESEEDKSDDADFCTEAEIRFAPPDGTSVQDLFNVIQECNKLHPSVPDDIASDDSDEVEDDEFHGNGLGDNGLILNGNPGQFDDVEEK